ncbi:hypothetical protein YASMINEVIRUS_940 [Yasminevirus sp. GU-2018]|uniref:Uncharacterized protein n=1 Tax=Yasminevirus sp. GU-2018 TaxID=2420051 RepID=A0A5K0U954_9VIRU|nr:hypothetical protein YASMINEVIRUS_940 [Yasminevirus sp. GU-2018]
MSFTQEDYVPHSIKGAVWTANFYENGFGTCRLCKEGIGKGSFFCAIIVHTKSGGSINPRNFIPTCGTCYKKLAGRSVAEVMTVATSGVPSTTFQNTNQSQLHSKSSTDFSSGTPFGGADTGSLFSKGFVFGTGTKTPSFQFQNSKDDSKMDVESSTQTPSMFQSFASTSYGPYTQHGMTLRSHSQAESRPVGSGTGFATKSPFAQDPYSWQNFGVGGGMNSQKFTSPFGNLWSTPNSSFTPSSSFSPFTGFQIHPTKSYNPDDCYDPMDIC